jgi:hypothetical protein
MTYAVNVTIFDIGGSQGTALNETRKIARGDYGNFDYIFGSYKYDGFMRLEGFRAAKGANSHRCPL